jgi:hypothetical protein
MKQIAEWGAIGSSNQSTFWFEFRNKSLPPTTHGLMGFVAGRRTGRRDSACVFGMQCQVVNYLDADPIVFFAWQWA